ncbi:hypothetical protein BMS3Bbin02_01260 [bacterium BMS3Bbin02]|nr:hypothetical protein BMS3Bbin02_01260 [bacterium BMS3Bbin02]
MSMYLHDKNKRDLTNVSDVLDGLIARIAGTTGGVLLHLKKAWPELAGPSWSGRSDPVRIDGDTLVIEVENGSVASLLRFESPTLLSDLESALGSLPFTKVRLRVRRRQ